MIRIFFLLFFGTLHCSYAGHKVCWTDEQDMQLMSSIQKHGRASWSTIAAEVTGKVNKQCRERYICHLDPLIDKSPLSDAEISTLELAVQELGPKWSEISKERFTLPTGIRRTDLQLKNVWHSQHRSERGEKKRKNTFSNESHLEETPTITLQQVLAPRSISATGANKKKQVPLSTATSSVFPAHPTYSLVPSGDQHLLSSSQLLLNGPSLLLPPSKTTHSENTPLHLQRTSQQSLTKPLAGIVLNTILDSSEFKNVFEGDGSHHEDASLLMAFSIKTLN